MSLPRRQGAQAAAAAVVAKAEAGAGDGGPPPRLRSVCIELTRHGKVSSDLLSLSTPKYASFAAAMCIFASTELSICPLECDRQPIEAPAPKDFIFSSFDLFLKPDAKW